MTINRHIAGKGKKVSKKQKTKKTNPYYVQNKKYGETALSNVYQKYYVH